MNPDEFVTYISGIEAPAAVANPYSGFREGCDAFDGASAARSSQLWHYLNHRLDTARILLIAEAPGYQGARFSGIAMTCERTLLGHRVNVTAQDVLGEGIQAARTSDALACRFAAQRIRGFAEPTAAIVWGELMRRGISREVVLWNAFPFHPHRPDNPLSNRKPTEQELADHRQVLERFRELFPAVQQVVAVGDVARDFLAGQNVAAEHVRHPANGGAVLFRETINQIFDQHF
ncbi:Uracil DNA glycosylase superfamily protein [Marinibacterium anthonyi]|nr:Uracil DNA glycosylase superfamily protein [Marinibacterium anthonyi]